MHIRHVMPREFQQGNSTKEKTKNICGVYGLITYREILIYERPNTILKDKLMTGHFSDFYDNLIKGVLEQNPSQ